MFPESTCVLLFKKKNTKKFENKYRNCFRSAQNSNDQICTQSRPFFKHPRHQRFLVTFRCSKEGSILQMYSTTRPILTLKKTPPKRGVYAGFTFGLLQNKLASTLGLFCVQSCIFWVCFWGPLRTLQPNLNLRCVYFGITLCA